jgi:hypothetical protein
MCKECHNKYNKARRNKHKTNVHELAFVDECAKRGIVAFPGVTMTRRHAWADVICGGVVRVEVKNGERNGASYNFRLTSKQTKQGFDADLVAFRVKDDWYFFPPDHTIFHRDNGRRKQAIMWSPGRIPDGRTYANGNPLTDDIMAAHKNLWFTIEQLRLSKAESIQADALQRTALPAAA